MNKLRSHTARIAVIVLLCAGFSLYMARPAQAEQSSQAFTRWFGTMAKPVVELELEQELDALVKIDVRLDELIAKASQIVSRYDGKFNFPFTETDAAHHVYQLLLIEWSQFQTGNEMAAVPPQVNVKPTPLSFDTLGAFGIIAQSTSHSRPLFIQQKLNKVRQANRAVSLVPMSSGIAICAP